MARPSACHAGHARKGFAINKHMEAPAEQRTIGGRFVVLSLLHSGNNVQTLLCEDRDSGDRVIVKALSSGEPSATAVAHLEHEAHVLSRLKSPYLAPVVHVGLDNGSLYLVMPFIDGITLRQRLDLGPLTIPDALRVGTCLMEALTQVHGLGILHRDIKSSNVIIPAAGPIDRAVLIDFGLAGSARLHASISDQAVGTVRYMSPEMAGLIEQEVDERSDLYSAGILLFEAISGRFPFDSSTVGDVLRQHLNTVPPELRGLGLEVPRAVDEVIQRLLRKDPRDRYQSAEAVKADLDEIAAGLELGGVDPPLIVGLHDVRRTLVEPSFVGRSHEREALRAHLEAAAQGEPQFVLVSSESGGGKSRLVDEFAKNIPHSGAAIFRGQGLDQAAQRPFQLLSGVALDLLDATQREPSLIDALRQRLGDQAEAVADAMPELAGVLDIPQTALGPEEHGEFRSIRGLTKLLDSLGTPERPAVVILDDCQWSDELTLKTLSWWADQGDRTELGPSHTLIIAAFRSEEVGLDHPLRNLEVSAHLELPALEDDDLRALAESMAGTLPEPALETVTRLSEGSPFMASAVLRGMVEVGALRAEPGGWEIDELAMTDVRSSRRSAMFLAQRLALLTQETQQILAVGAILGKEFELGLAAVLAGMTLPEAMSAIYEARHRHIVWVELGGGRAEFVHDKLRETVIDSIDLTERAASHLRAAVHLESADPERVFDIAYHFDAAGDSAKALPYALEAAAQARAQHALEVTENQYRIAGRGVDEDDSATRLVIDEGLGDTLMLRGLYEDAEPYLRDALTLSEDRDDRSRILGKIGELAFKKGDIDAAERALEDALRTLGRRVPKRMVGFVAMAAWEIWVQILHTLFPRLFLGRSNVEEAQREFIAIRLYSRSAYMYWFGRGSIPCLWAHLREMNLAEKYPPTPELAQAYSEHAPVMTLVTHYKRGIAYAEKSLKIRTSIGDVWGQGQSLHFYGVVLYGASRYQECIDKCRQAVRLLERTGDRWEVNTATWHIAFAHYRMGELRTAVEIARRVHQAGRDIGDSQARGISLGAWSKASGGDVPAGILEAELDAVGRDKHTGAELMQAEGVRLIGEGKHAEAAERFRQARKMTLKAGVMQEYVAPIFPWLVTAIRLQAESTPTWAPRTRSKLMRRAVRASRWAMLVASRYRNNRPHALREAGVLAAARGKHRRALRLLDRSLTVADAQSARYESAQTLLARGRVGIDLGWEGSQDDIAAGQAAVLEMEAGTLQQPAPEARGEPATPSLVDRFDNLLEVGREIAGSLTREAVFSSLHSSALTLLRGERCVIFDISRSAREPGVILGETDVAFSRSLVQAAVERARPMVLSEDLPEDASESLVLTGVRSAICAPIFVRGHPEACLLVLHHEVGSLYGEDEERIAGFLAGIAGAAIENADGFTEVQELTRSLEARVTERTAELAEANTRLESANSAMRDFVSAASHDLRTPITAILGFTSTMGMNWEVLEDPQKKQMLDIIDKQSHHLSRIVDDLLTISNIEAGVIETHKESLRIRTEIEQSIEYYGQTHEIHISCPADLQVLADSDHCQRILANYVGNAVKYGKPRFEIKAVESGPWVEVRVCDEGPGVPGEFAERLFEKFTRANTAATRKERGTGLGLSIVKGLAEANGGEAWYEANSPRGAQFVVKLPKS